MRPLSVSEIKLFYFGRHLAGFLVHDLEIFFQKRADS